MSPYSSRPWARRVGAHLAVLESISVKSQMAVSQSNRTQTKISHDSGQWLNSFMILSVSESDNHD